MGEELSLHELQNIGLDILLDVHKFCERNDICYSLAYGTLLGAFRDNSFVPNELDLDIGAYLKDAKQIFNALKKSGFVLVREFHIVGENGLEQTYSYKGTTLDVMYFFHEKSSLFCTGANFDLMKV